jgi:hypothetical protein
LQRGGALYPAPVNQQQAASWSQPGRDRAQRRPPVGQVAGSVEADGGIKGRLGKVAEVHDVMLDEPQIRPSSAHKPAAGVGELAVGQVHADHLRGCAVGQPCRERAAAAGHIQDPPGSTPPDRLEVALVGLLVGGGHVGWVVARLEHGQVKELAPVGVVELGQGVKPDEHVLAVMLAPLPRRGHFGDRHHRPLPSSSGVAGPQPFYDSRPASRRSSVRPTDHGRVPGYGVSRKCATGRMRPE